MSLPWICGLVLMCAFYIGMGLFAAYEKGVEAGSKRQLANVGQGTLLGQLTVKLPRRDVQSINLGYCSEDDAATIVLRRADRLTIETKECTHQEIGLGALMTSKTP